MPPLQNKTTRRTTSTVGKNEQNGSNQQGNNQDVVKQGVIQQASGVKQTGVKGADEQNGLSGSAKNEENGKKGFFSRMGKAFKSTGSKIASKTGNLIVDATMRESDLRQRVSGKDRSLVERNQGLFSKLFKLDLPENEMYTHAGFLCTVIQNISTTQDDQMQKWDKALQEIVAAPNKPVPEITEECADHIKPELVNYKLLAKKYAEVIDVMREIQKARKNENDTGIKGASEYRKRLHDLEYEICTLKDNKAVEKRNLEYLKRSDKTFLERLLDIKNEKLDPTRKQKRMTAAFVAATKAYDTYFKDIIAKMKLDKDNDIYNIMYNDLKVIQELMNELRKEQNLVNRNASIEEVIELIKKTQKDHNDIQSKITNKANYTELHDALVQLMTTLQNALQSKSATAAAAASQQAPGSGAGSNQLVASTNQPAAQGGKAPRIKGPRPAKKSTAAKPNKPKPRTRTKTTNHR